MGAEILLYGYGLVCLGMLIFNILYNLSMKGSQHRLERRSVRLERQVEKQLLLLRQGETLEDRHLSWLRRRLSRVSGLLAFDRVMDGALALRDDPAAQTYLQQLQPLLLQLAMTYRKRENLQAAYFAYFLTKHRQMREMPMDAIQEVMVEYLRKDSLYCRMNALDALYAFGTPERVVEAVALQDRLGMFFHEKVLTDGLLSFRGDHERLTALLWSEFESFSDKTRLCVLNYIRFHTGNYRPEMLEILRDSARDKELRLSAMRYFGRYFYAPARETLLQFLRTPDPVHWEYAAVAANALAAYPGEDTVQALMDAMHSSVWYVRYNAADSLERLELDYSDLIQVMGGRDRYAREMLMYRMDIRLAVSEDEAEAEKKEETLCVT